MKNQREAFSCCLLSSLGAEIDLPLSRPSPVAGTDFPANNNSDVIDPSIAEKARIRRSLAVMDRAKHAFVVLCLPRCFPWDAGEGSTRGSSGSESSRSDTSNYLLHQPSFFHRSIHDDSKVTT
jgi:hypothetical protein